jgi:molecular chaperone GrpE
MKKWIKERIKLDKNSENLNSQNDDEELSQEEKEKKLIEDSLGQLVAIEVKKYEEKVATLEKEVSENNDRFLRKAAEFENYKRRTENDQLNLIKYAAEPLIKRILTVVDDFERSLVHLDDSKDDQSVKDGIKMIYEKLVKILEEQGITKIEAVGKPFSVEFHEALMQRKADDVPAHTVVDEIEAGYMYKDKVIRHSKVVVSEDSTD